MSRVVGILGGMGPLATADFYRRLIEATPAIVDQEHLRVTIDADPTVPDRTAALRGQGEDPTPWLLRGAQRLAASGAELIAVPCNTAHAFLPAVRAVTPIPILDMIAETAQRTIEVVPRAGVVGLLATRGTLGSRLYHDAYARLGFVVLEPSDAIQTGCVDVAIALVKAGRNLPSAAALLRNAARELHLAGARVLVAGCTEIPVVLRPELVPAPLLDSTQILAEATVREARAMVSRATA